MQDERKIWRARRKAAELERQAYADALQSEIKRLTNEPKTTTAKVVDSVATSIARVVRIAIAATLWIVGIAVIHQQVGIASEQPIGSLSLSDLSGYLFWLIVAGLGTYICYLIGFAPRADDTQDRQNSVAIQAQKIVDGKVPPRYYRVFTPNIENLDKAEKWGPPITRIRVRLYREAAKNGGTISNLRIREICAEEGEEMYYVRLMDPKIEPLRHHVLVPVEPWEQRPVP